MLEARESAADDRGVAALKENSIRNLCFFRTISRGRARCPDAKRRTYDQRLYQKASSRPGRGFTCRNYFDSAFHRFFGTASVTKELSQSGQTLFSFVFLFLLLSNRLASWFSFSPVARLPAEAACPRTRRLQEFPRDFCKQCLGLRVAPPGAARETVNNCLYLSALLTTANAQLTRRENVRIAQ